MAGIFFGGGFLAPFFCIFLEKLLTINVKKIKKKTDIRHSFNIEEII